MSLATGDKSMMPELARLDEGDPSSARVPLAPGVTSFCHAGRQLNGYGCMNLPGLVLTTGAGAGPQAGVKDPAVDRAIAKPAKFLR